MKRQNARTSCKVLFFSIAALSRAWGGDIAAAEEKSQTMANLQGLVAFAEQAGKSPVSIAFAQTAGGPQNDNDMECGTLAWGKSMLAEMEMALATREGKAIAVADDILSFRDWCLGAPGGGNLALAVSAEEVAVELMFRELAEENADDRKVRGSFDRCARHGMTADYWLASLGAEGIDARGETTPDKGVAEYLRLKAVFAVVAEKCAGPSAHSFFPIITQSRGECLDTFNPYALMLRTLMLEDKKVSLETCLAMQEATGSIPEEREEFRRVAENCADSILRKRDRLTSWTTAYDVWNDWADALDAVRPGSQPRRSRH